MNFRRQLLFFTLICIINIIAFDNYYTKYHIDSLIKNRLIQLKFRCYRYYENNQNSELTNIVCSPYKYDYILFSLERSRYIALCCGFNLILSFFYILIIYII